MTNADKYLKDGVDVDELRKEFEDWYAITRRANTPANYLVEFLNEEVKPTLTEDEKVLLRNIRDDNWAIVGKTDFNELYLANYCKNCDVFVKEIFKKDLFQFIKPRRRI